MKKIFAMILAALFLVACNDNKKPTSQTSQPSQAEVKQENNTSLLSDAQMSFRKGDLENESDAVIPDVQFSSAMPGESQLLDRSFENAPPLISHSNEGLLPITKDMNSCLTCHDKAIAADVAATSMPATHYIDLRTGKSTGDNVSEERFNCTACHVEQSNAKPLVGNTFVADFQNNESLKRKSNLIDVLNEGVK